MIGKSTFFESNKIVTLSDSEATTELSEPQTTESEILESRNWLNQRKIWF